jgi:hypothetical protein
MIGHRSAGNVAVGAVLAAASLAASISWGDEARPARRTDGRLRPAATVQTEVEGCLQPAAATVEPGRGLDCAGVVLLAQGSALAMRHFDSTLNCCSDVSVAVHLDTGAITFRELEAGEMCHCQCTYDLAAEVSGLAPGVYQVEVESSLGEALCQTSVELPAAAPDVAYAHSLCITPPDGGVPPESVTTTLKGRTLEVEHRNVRLNCCLDLTVELERGPGWLRLREDDGGPPCDCLCTFDLFAVVPDLEPGRYQLEIVGCDGRVVQGGEVDVPLP